MNPDDCQDVVELITDYLEDSLGAEDRAAFEVHLGTCPGCVRYLAQVRATVDLLGREAVSDGLPPETVEGLVAAFTAALRPRGRASS